MVWHWHISDVKRNARGYMAGSYWKTVLVALVLAIIGTSGGSGISGARTAGSVADWADFTSGSETLHDGIRSFWFSWGSQPFHFHGFHASGSGFFPFGAWTPGIMIASTFIILIGLVILLAGFGVKVFLFNPIETGCQRFFVVNHVESGRTSLGEMFHSFNGQYYLNVVKTLFLRDLYVWLWSLLFVIPGIIKSYSYRLVPYILAEQPDMDEREAFRLSREMMDGNKWHAFCLDLSFIGWEILNVCTLGILGIFYVKPYRQTANAEMYIAIRDEYFHRA